MADTTVTQAFAAVPEPILFESDVSLIAQAMLTGFQAGYYAATGTPISLGAADPRRYELLYQADLISQSYAAGNWVAKQDMLKYAVGPNLDVLGSFWGDMGKRLQPSQAVTEMVFTIAAASGTDITIPTGTACATTDGSLVYSTLADAVISAGSLFSSALAQCTTPGAIGNTPALNSITVLQNWNQPYVVSVYNSTLPSGGADLETDDRYRVRLYKLPKGLSTCGTRESYEFYALSANPSIAMVSVYSNPGIAGTVILTP
jgi:phage-related baseplate assembly protein